MRALLGRAAYLVWCLLTLVVLFANVRLYFPSVLPRSDSDLPAQIPAQLKSNRRSLESGVPAEMQQYFPEGYYFCYVWHGLTWVEVGLRDPERSNEAIDQAHWCLEHLNSADGRAAFPESLPPEHGMFYSAWKCALLSGIVLLQDGRNEAELSTLQAECDAIAAALNDQETPFPASYHNQAWPCDTVPAIHAMAIHGRVTGDDRYTKTIKRWLGKSRKRLDPASGLLPHSADPTDGHNGTVARSTSQMIILRFLADAAPEFGRAQYEAYRNQFLTSFAGIPCVREYPAGIDGKGDLDSGPLIFGHSLPATVLMMGTARIYGDDHVAAAISQAGETVGLPWTSDAGKTYFGDALPIGSIIVTWSQIARPWLGGKEHQVDARAELSPFWRWPVHLWSCLMAVPVIIERRRKRKTQGPQES